MAGRCRVPARHCWSRSNCAMAPWRTRGHGPYGVVRGERDSWLLRSREAEDWVVEYAFTTEPQYPIDYTVHNHYTSTHPNSPFVSQIVALRKTDTSQYALRGRTLSIESPGSPLERCVVSDGWLGNVLRQIFGIELDPDELESLASAG
ncbi:MAG: arylamine N-acetyltransferase [Thermomicrobiales bacterium]